MSLADPMVTLPDGILEAIVKVESNGNKSAISPGPLKSYGIAQITVATGKEICGIINHKQLLIMTTNLRCAAKILLLSILEASGDIPMTVAAYNAGTPCLCKENRFYAWGRVNLCKYQPRGGCEDGKFQNQEYVDKVMQAWVKS